MLSPVTRWNVGIVRDLQGVVRHLETATWWAKLSVPDYIQIIHMMLPQIMLRTYLFQLSLIPWINIRTQYLEWKTDKRNECCGLWIMKWVHAKRIRREFEQLLLLERHLGVHGNVIGATHLKFHAFVPCLLQVMYTFALTFKESVLDSWRVTNSGCISTSFQIPRAECLTDVFVTN
jgi:hypothetical protein